ncbi:MAG: PIG-L family deacetylase [Eubacteriales bacterium]|nr:PIG-L family deacetylase [Eubacteriales bacterium]
MSNTKTSRVMSLLMALAIILSSVTVASTPITVHAGTFSKNGFTVTTYDLKRPKVLKKGSGYSISGKLKANHTVKQFKIGVYDRNQFRYDKSYTRNVSTKTINLKDYQSKIKFGSLPSGEKELRYILTDKDGNQVKLVRNFTVLGKAKGPRSMTSACHIGVSRGTYKSVTDADLSTGWSHGTMTIRLPKDRTADGMAVKWDKFRNYYSIKVYDADNNVIKEYKDGYAKLHEYFSFGEGARKVVLKLNHRKGSKGVLSLRVYEKDKVGPSVEQWKSPKRGECDLMVVSAHRDDELLFFGGTIPYYQNVKKKNVYTMYVSGREKHRAREAQAGLWSMGVDTYPIFMDYAGGYHDGISGTLRDWGGETAVLKKMVEKIRCYQPDVVVTHDKNGEYGHPTHKTVSYITLKAVNMAKDKTKFTESYKKYGTWRVKKVYFHYTNKNTMYMNWDNTYKELDYRTPYQMAKVGFDKHYSQHNGWSMTCDAVKKYSNRKFGLVYTTVGKDKKKNDFFEHID